MANVYMSAAESEARSVYASNPTTAGYMGGSYSSQRYYEQQRQRDEEQRQQQRYQDNRPAGYVGGTFNPQTGETTGGHPAEATMAADRARSGMTQQQTQDMNMGYEEYRRSRAVEEAQGRFAGSSAQKDYYDRPDIFKPDDPAQLNLMRQGYTAEQSAEMLRVDAAKRQDYAAERKYETLRLQAWTTATGESAAYHTAARDSGLPQAANPYEYGADLFTYAEKGYPQKRSEAFSPVDYGILNLPNGQGGQAYIWKSDSERQYDLRPAMDKVAYAQRSGQMGVYGGLSASSSAYGKLSLEEQQAVGRYVNENPIHQAAGFRTNEGAMNQFTPEIRAKNQGAFVSSISPTIASSQPAMGEQNAKRPFLSAYAGDSQRPQSKIIGSDMNPMIVSAAPLSGNISQQAEPSAYRKSSPATPDFALDAGGDIKRPFTSTSMTDRVEVTKEKQSGALPYVGVVPGLSPFIANFMPQNITTKTTGKEKDFVIGDYDRTPEGGYGAAQTRTFMTDKGKSDTWTYPVGEPVLSAPTPKGKPILTRTYDPKTGETITYSEQPMEQMAMQNYETVTLPKTMRGQEITTVVTPGSSPFTESVQKYMPVRGEQKTTLASSMGLENKPKQGSSIFGSWDTGDGKPTYLLSPVIGQERATYLDESTKGAVSFVQKNVPMTPVWAQTSYKNIREDPLFAAPIVAMSVMLPATGGALRYVAPATASRVFAAPAYQAASQVATVGLGVLFADYASKEVTGTSFTEILGNERNRQMAAGGYKTDKPAQSSSQLIQKQWIGWDKSGDKANRLQLEMAAGFAAYSGTTWAVDRTVQFKNIRTDAKGQPAAATAMSEADARKFSIESNEGFPTLNSIEQKDLRQSFIDKMWETANIGKKRDMKMSATGRTMGERDFPTNTQVYAEQGKTDIFTGQPRQTFDRNYASVGVSEIQGKFYSEGGITYFAKASETGAGLGISNDILGLGKRPTMYVSAVDQKYVEVPKHIRETPTLGLSANDPGNPRNMAITDWINRNVEPGVPVLVQYGKSEFVVLIRAGSEVTPKKHLGYYMDNGIPIQVIRQDYTGRIAPDFVPQPLQPKEYKFYSGLAIGETGSAIGSSAGGERERVIAYGAGSLFKSTARSPTIERSTSLSQTRPRTETLALSKSISSISKSQSTSSGRSSRSPSQTSSISESMTRSPSRTPSLFRSATPSKTTTTPKYETTLGKSKTPSISTSLSRSTSSMTDFSRSRSRTTSQTPSRSITTSLTPSRTRTTIPVEPPFIGGFGAGMGSGRSRSGRRHTEVFSTAMGQLTGNLFGGGGYNNESVAPKRKSVYGNFKGTFTTGRGKTIRVKPMPKRMYD